MTIIPGLPRKRSRWVDWYGNIEATPPFQDPEGRWHRYGRVITGKQRDDLQAAMALLRGAKLAVPLQFDNFRD